MNICKKHTIKIRFYISAFLLLLVALFISVRLNEKSFSIEQFTSSLQNKVIYHDNKISLALEQLKINYNNDPKIIAPSVNEIYPEASKLGFTFLIIQNDSLIYWSDNFFDPTTLLNNQEIPDAIHTGNGYYRIIKSTIGERIFCGIYVIKYDYVYQNDLLKNTFHPSFNLSNNVNLSLTTNDHCIYSESGTFLFSVLKSSYKDFTTQNQFLIIFLYFFLILSALGILYELHLSIFKKTAKRMLFIFGFVMEVLLFRAILFYFHIDKFFTKSPLFGPLHYAHNDLIPSIADLFLHVLFLFIISIFLYYHLKFDIKKLHRNTFHRFFIIISLFIHIYIFSKLIIFISKTLVFDSNISLNLNNFFSLSYLSFFNIVILLLAIFSFFFVSIKLGYFAYKYSNSLKNYLFTAVLVSLGLFLILLLKSRIDIFNSLAILFYTLSLGLFIKHNSSKFTLANIVFYIVFFSLFSTHYLHQFNKTKEIDYRKLLSIHLSSEQRDPLAEFLFIDINSEINRDSTLISKLSEYDGDEKSQNSIEQQILNNYFFDYWAKFDIQFTICKHDDLLHINPEDVYIDCNEFFQNIIDNQSSPTDCQNLYFINYGPGVNGYLAAFNFNSYKKEETISVYIEVTPKNVSNALGFPELLVNQNLKSTPDLTEYSYAKFQNNILFKRVGDFFYKTNISYYGDFNTQFQEFDFEGYNHLYYKIDGEKSLIISKKNNSLFDELAPFSFLYLFFGAFTIFIFFIFIYPLSKTKIKFTFRTRLQISMASVILFSFLVIGIFSLRYVYILNDQKNRDILSEKTHSVLVELQHKLSDIQYLDNYMPSLIDDLLIKFSSVFFTDINLFDLSGNLISTSRPQIFDEQLISRKMNAIAFRKLAIDENSFFIHDENIGKQNFLSAYMPFINDQGEIIAYLNLPYFAKESDIKSQVTTFLLAYINIYVILIAISILIALIISNYISRPINMIMNKIKRIQLGGQNEKIKWQRDDEIGKLVFEYNRMIDELAHSAELLARSEREYAWREMAKQVAHEIKNPLTPMKLNVQHLQKSWMDGAVDWDKKLNKFTKSMIEQIDTLSLIASEFSDFAKMPVSKKSNLNIVEVLETSVSLFKNYSNLKIKIHFVGPINFIVYADYDQLLRAFNNLIKNGVQAIGNKPDGKIDISISGSSASCIIQIHDNGKGIPEDIMGKIFSPNFTTKTTGMGMGLAIVKNIITGSKGTITYSSSPDKGTTFKITLPSTN